MDEVEETRQECPDIELEVFVHGALCIAYSGVVYCLGILTIVILIRALVPTPVAGSIQLNLNNAGYGDQERHPFADQVYFLEKKEHPSELMPIMEDVPKTCAPWSM